jgi:hypothetical protein
MARWKKNEATRCDWSRVYTIFRHRRFLVCISARPAHTCVSHSPNSARSAERVGWNYTGTVMLGGALAAGGGAIRSRRPAASLALSGCCCCCCGWHLEHFCNYKTPAANLIRPLVRTLTWAACPHLIAFRVKVHIERNLSRLSRGGIDVRAHLDDWLRVRVAAAENLMVLYIRELHRDESPPWDLHPQPARVVPVFCQSVLLSHSVLRIFQASLWLCIYVLIFYTFTTHEQREIIY